MRVVLHDKCVAVNQEQQPKEKMSVFEVIKNTNERSRSKKIQTSFWRKELQPF